MFNKNMSFGVDETCSNCTADLEFSQQIDAFQNRTKTHTENIEI